MQNGRRPNKNQDKSALKRWVGWAGSTFLDQWAKDKGLLINPFAVAWKIARKGIPVPNKYNKGGLVSDVITEAKIRELGQKLTLNQVTKFRSDVLKDLKK